MGNYIYKMRDPKDFSCSMDGYVELTLETYNVLLFGLALLKEAYAAMLPKKLGKSVNYAWDGLLGAGAWLGFLSAALYYFGLEAGYGKIMCDVSGTIWMLVGVTYQLL